MKFNDAESVDVRLSTDELLYALEHDEEFFIEFNLKHELTHPVPEFHKTSFKLLINSTVSRIALALPRNHAKTTLAKLAAVWYFVFTSFRFVLYSSNTSTVACNACSDIIGFMETDNFRNVFGEIEWIRRRDGDGFFHFKFRGKVCILRALGAGQQIRGLNVDNQRPQLLVVDDLEDDDNTDTEYQHTKLKRWTYGALMKALDAKQNKIIWLGNMITAKCMLQEHCDSDFWYSMRYGCLLTDGTPLWPDLYPVDALRADFMQYKDAQMLPKWFAEMMNIPVPGSSGLIMPGDINYAPPVMPREAEYGFITIDPAISKSAWADNTAIVVHAFLDDRWQIVDYFCDKIDPEQMYHIAVEFCKEWGFRVIGIETIAYQASLEYLFRMYNIMYSMELEIVPLVSQQRKAERLSGWCALIKSGVYALTEGDIAITQQLLTYDVGKKENDDDLIDAGAYGEQMIDKYIHLISAVYNNFTENNASQDEYRCTYV